MIELRASQVLVLPDGVRFLAAWPYLDRSDRRNITYQALLAANDSRAPMIVGNIPAFADIQLVNDTNLNLQTA